VSFADGTPSRLPTRDEAMLYCGNDKRDSVIECLTAIGMTYLSPGTSSYDNHNTWTSTPNPNSGNGYFLVDYYGSYRSDSETSSCSLPVCTPRAVPLNKPVDLGLPSGRLWSNINLGAASAEEAGLYYQWGNLDGHDGEDGYDFSSTHYAETPGSQVSASVLPLANDAANDTLGGCWRIPTLADFNELIDTNYTTWLWTTINRVDGYRITSKSNGNSIFIPVTGHIDQNGTLQNNTAIGEYWTADSYNFQYAFICSVY
jgi:hypothetical protein